MMYSYYQPFQPGDGSGNNSFMDATHRTQTANQAQMNKFGSQRFQTDEQIRMAQTLHPQQMQLAMAGQAGRYLDSSQIRAAKGNFAPTQRMITDQEGVLKRRQEQGLFNPDELAGMQQLLGQSYGDARTLMQTGGADENYGHGATSMRENMGRLGNIAQNGKYSASEFDDILAAQHAEVADAGRAAASSAYNNQLGASIAPFAAAAIQSQTGTAAGRARADARAGLTREQADSRQSAANQAGALGNALGEMSISLGRNKLAGMGEQNKAAAAIQSMLSDHAGGRMEAGRQLGSLIGTSGDIASKLAELDTRGMPAHLQKMMKQIANQVAHSKTQQQQDVGRGNMFNPAFRG